MSANRMILVSTGGTAKACTGRKPSFSCSAIALHAANLNERLSIRLLSSVISASLTSICWRSLTSSEGSCFSAAARNDSSLAASRIRAILSSASARQTSGLSLFIGIPCWFAVQFLFQIGPSHDLSRQLLLHSTRRAAGEPRRLK